ncbi:MAG TPA: hypothetical protein VMZ52_10810, partial [Bryobacteraceae bacterium]|nr:hypothetical protein [Bryobacteraceae bacterium]
AAIYLLVTRQFFQRRTWQRLRPWSGLLIILAIAAPWHILATLRNPPSFDFTMRSEPGKYHGFFWFYLFNEHVFRFLNMRHPRDYNTVPRLLFWAFHLLWLFPWSVFFPSAARLGYKPLDRPGRTRLLCLCWIGFLLVFFTFSTTQEYYSMPCYPALALLLGCAMAAQNKWDRIGTRLVCLVSAAAALAIGVILYTVVGLPTPGDISNALTQNPEAYTLSLGHMGDLTIASFAYLRVPLALAGIAFLTGVFGTWRFRAARTYFAMAFMMVLFLQAARLAMITFDPYLSSRPLAEALLRAPEGQLIVDDQYYTFSSVFFYTGRNALLLNGRVNNLEYGSYAPGAPDVFIDYAKFQQLWAEPRRYYLVIEKPSLDRLKRVAGEAALQVIAASGGKLLISNHANLH